MAIVKNLMIAHRFLNELLTDAPATATTEDNVTKVRQLIWADHRLKVRKIVEIKGISKHAWIISYTKYWA